MAPRCFPADPAFESAAERLVFDAFRDQLPDDAVLLAGLRFSDRRVDREADLVVVQPGVGAAVIEVKGATVSLEGGRWFQTSRAGDRVPIHPVDQARQCKYLLRDYLRHHPGWRHADPRMVHLVAFPDTDVPAGFRAPDCRRDMVIALHDVVAAATVVRDALAAAEGAGRPPTAAEVEDLVECLAGRMLPQRDLVSEAAVRERTCDQLTRAQATVLDLIREIPRVEVRGGAGSGKTWLAVEKARRLASSGQRVGLLCYSHGLSAYLVRRVALLPERERPAYVGMFHPLGVAWGAAPGLTDDNDYWERRLPEEMSRVARYLPDAQRFDSFVVDEAQDFADSWWPALVAGLRDAAGGGLYAFADEGQRVFARQGRPPLELVPVPLDENLRNTKQIAQTFGSLTSTQMRNRGGDGAPVRFVPCSSDEALTAADDAVDGLLQDGWMHEHVALLTTGSRHPVQVERQSHGQDRYWESYWAGDDVFYGHVLGFKGLERPVVVLAVNGFGAGDERAKEKLYVGLSRPRDLLVVCGDRDVIRAVGGQGVLNRLTR